MKRKKEDDEQTCYVQWLTMLIRILPRHTTQSTVLAVADIRLSVCHKRVLFLYRNGQSINLVFARPGRPAF